MEDDPVGASYLQVPITERERAQQRQRSRASSDASSRLLAPDDGSVYSQPFDDSQSYSNYSSGPSRFGSIRGNDSNQYVAPPSEPRRFHSYQGAPYAPISPIDEELESRFSSLNNLTSTGGRGPASLHTTASDAPSRPRTIPQSEKSFTPLVPLPPLWTPFWLRRSVLIAFIAFFVAGIIALVVLWVLSATRAGFETHVDGPHHAWWVYIPTILVVLLVGCWRQVDYHVKSLTPWDELQNGPVGPGRSLLADYVSNLQIVAGGKAFVNGHWGIVATVAAFVGFKIITVFSTGLFILLPKNVSQNGFPLTVTTRFDAAGVSDLNAITARPVNTFFGTTYQGIPEAPGVWPDLAYTSFQYDQSRNVKLGDNATFTANVDAFVPVITCRVVEADLDGNSTVEQSAIGDVYGEGVRLAIPGDDLCRNWPAIVVQTLNPEKQIAPTSQTVGSIHALPCGSDDQPAALLFSLLKMSFEQELRPGSLELALAGDTVATSSSRTVRNMANVLCQASHTITTVKVSNDTLEQDSPTQGIELALVSNAQNKTLAGLSDGAFMAAFARIANVSGDVFGQTVGADTTSGFFALLAMHFGSRDPGQLMNANDLMAAVEPTFRGIMAQYAHQSLSQPVSDNLTGQAVRRETRYVVNDASAAVIIAALLGGVVAGAMLLFSAPRGVVPRNPGPVAANAAVLTNSIELNRLLRRGGIPSNNNAEVAVDGYEFGTAIATTEHGQASFKVVTSEGVHDHNLPHPDRQLKWWHPITSSIFFVVPTVTLPILIIGLLEFTQSKSGNGIVDVPDDLATDIYTHYIPSLVMVIIASMVNLIDFNVMVFTPWAALAKGAATHKKSILAYYLGMTPFETAFRGFRVRHMNVVASAIAVMIASILAIVAAGLYNGDRFRSEGTTINLIQADSFTLEWSDSAQSDNGAAGILGSVLHDNLSYPEFTFRNLVLPAFMLENGDLSLTNGSTRDTSANTTQVEVDALLPDLTCYLVDRNFITLIPDGTDMDVNIQATLPETCELGGVDGQASFISFDTTFQVPEQGSLIAGRQFDLLFGNGGSLVNNVLSESQLNFSSLIGDNPAVGCPSLAFVYGSFTANNENATDLTALLCYQNIMSVKSRFHLISNTTLIDARRGVTVNQTDASLLKNPLSTASSTDDADKVFDFRIQGNLARSFRPFTDTADSSTLDLDPFFQGVVHADPSTTIQPSSLLGESNQTELLTAILNFYRLYMAQAISLNMRSSSSTNTNNNTSTLKARQITQQQGATLATIPTTLTRIRLVQDSTTKLLLQVLLALTSALTLLSWLLTRFHRVLPLPPFSIANNMALLAGSDLAHTDEVEDPGALCECCGKPRSRPHDGDGESLRGRPPSSRSDMVRLSVPEGLEFDQRTSSPAGSREGVVPAGAEWWGAAAGSGTRMPVLGGGKAAMTKEGKGRWEVVFAGRRYSMGWWKENPAKGRMRSRWGVDVGERADGADEGEWMLGRRRLRNSTEGSVGVRLEGQGHTRGQPSLNIAGQQPHMEGAYEGQGYGAAGLGQEQTRPRPSSDLGYSAQREYFPAQQQAAPSAAAAATSATEANANPFAGAATPFYDTAPNERQQQQPASTAPWSLGARRLRDSEHVTPSMRFEAPASQYVPERFGPGRGGRALDVPTPLGTPGLFDDGGGYGEGGIGSGSGRGGGVGIASSDRGDDSESGSENEWDRESVDLGDRRGVGTGSGAVRAGMNFSMPGRAAGGGGQYRRVDGGGAGGGGGEA